MSTSKKRVTIGTHAGTFHCDEVMACFMLRQLPRFADAKIVRSRDPNILKQCDIVVDTGGEFDKNKNLFDHEQATFNETFSSLRPEFKNYNVRLSSAGLIYTYFGEEVIQEILKKKCDLEVDITMLKKIFEKVYQGLIQEIDGTDNKVPMFECDPVYRITSNISARVGRFNPAWNSTGPINFQSRFEKAMDVAGEEFVGSVVYYGSVWYPARAIVQEALGSRFDVHCSGEILWLSQKCPWKDHLFDLESENGLDGVVKYVVTYSEPNEYIVTCMRNKPGSFVFRKLLHEKWRGKFGADLQKISGIESAVFVNSIGYIGGCNTKAGALDMAIRSL